MLYEQPVNVQLFVSALTIAEKYDLPPAAFVKAYSELAAEAAGSLVATATVKQDERSAMRTERIEKEDEAKQWLSRGFTAREVVQRIGMKEYRSLTRQGSSNVTWVYSVKRKMISNSNGKSNGK